MAKPIIPQICIGDYVLDISPSAKFCADPTRDFSPHMGENRNITPRVRLLFRFFGVLQRGYSRGPKTDLHEKYIKRRGPTQGCAFWGF